MFYPELINIPPILDFEASSLSESQSYPISVGLIVSGRTYYSLIKPEPDWTDWSAQSEGVHGLPRSRLMAEGRPVAEVCASLVALLGERDIAYSDNPEWESRWASRMGLNQVKFRDIASLVSPDKVHDFHQAVDDAHNRMSSQRHHALSDVLALTQALQRLQH